MNLSKYYWKILLLPSSGLVVGHIIYLIWDENWGPGKNYKSEWLTSGSLNGLVILMVILNAFIIALLTLPIFLNNHDYIRKNFIFSFLSWFALPLIWIFYFLYKAIIGNGFNSDNNWILLNVLPFSISLIIGFVIFRLRLNKRPW
jgi:hypothetical protein